MERFVCELRSAWSISGGGARAQGWWRKDAALLYEADCVDGWFSPFGPTDSKAAGAVQRKLLHRLADESSRAAVLHPVLHLAQV